MKILFFLILSFITFSFFLVPEAYSLDPFERPNNRIGIHILSPSEISLAASMVNGGGGDWGYVVIPIQANDKDIKKWQQFMNEAKKLHIIPIIRIATTSDYFDTASWYQPSFYDIVDFSNFLNSLVWPTKNRYVIIFNEPNRADEWGGNPNAEEYAKILSYAVDVFKAKSEDFFIISAGLDNAANEDGKSISSYNFLKLMNKAVPGIFNKIDGFASHSYPNPGFKQSPFISTPHNIYSFSYEQDLIYSLSGRKLPIFITETGWSSKEVSRKIIKSYFEYALNNVWIDNYIVVISPFLLQASGPYSDFSFINDDERELYDFFQNLEKVKGRPLLSYSSTNIEVSNSVSPFGDESGKISKASIDAPKINLKILKEITKWLLKI